jgi:atypical dual specificity phosphatase
LVLPHHGRIGRPPAELRTLRGLGVRAVVNLCEEHPGFAREIEALGMSQLHVPTLDFHAPTPDALRQAVEFICARAAAGEPVYVHCNGRKRSPLVAIAYLMRSKGLTATAAYERVFRARRHIDRGLAHQAVLRAYAPNAGEPATIVEK